MKNTQTLIDALNQKAIRFEHRESMIGITFGKHVWHWFDCKYDLITFDHSYSQNTGKTFRGVMHGVNVVLALNKRLKITI